ncbi:MAG TPA: ATP-binding protein [Lachnospiraceae bacterium]|nr:ATP-binding protein [Lachnospiraceae bacterium]
MILGTGHSLPSMRKKLFSTVCVLVLVSVILTSFLAEIMNYNSILNAMRTDVKNEAGLIVSAINLYGDSYLTGESKDSAGKATAGRITLISADGTVLYDSWENDVSSLANHASRTEVASAYKNGSGESLRYSETLGKVTYYYAVRLESGEVLRTAGTIDTVWSLFLKDFEVFVIFITILILAVLLITGRLTKKIVQPINSLDLGHPLCNNVYEEMNPLLERIDEQNRIIDGQLADLRKNHEEYVKERTRSEEMRREFTANVSHELKTPLMSISGYAELIENNIARAEDIPGFAGKIRSEAARLSLLVQDIINLSEMDEKEEAGNEEVDLLEVAHEAVESLNFEAHRLRVHVSVLGTESFSGVGSIQGDASAQDGGSIQVDASAQDGGSIQGDAYVQDGGSIQGDASAQDGDSIQGDASAQAGNSVRGGATASGFYGSASAAHPTVRGNRKMLYEMTRNLLDNAIKYNHPGGYAKVAVGWTVSPSSKEGRPLSCPFISVEDNGIGIPKEDTDRIFERFYRVDKSHSRATGGTGLGLSIVKHAALLHKGTIEVLSGLGSGTVITVKFQMPVS